MPLKKLNFYRNLKLKKKNVETKNDIRKEVKEKGYVMLNLQHLEVY